MRRQLQWKSIQPRSWGSRGLSRSTFRHWCSREFLQTFQPFCTGQWTQHRWSHSRRKQDCRAADRRSVLETVLVLLRDLSRRAMSRTSCIRWNRSILWPILVSRTPKAQRQFQRHRWVSRQRHRHRCCRCWQRNDSGFGKDNVC